MKRRLLPYEHELVRALGVSEEEYLDFLAVQHDFTRSPEEKLQELRGDPVSITLAVVGIIFQVVSVLLAPKPITPEVNASRQRRDQQFSPRFGFNSAQDLAKYGDPINLVYCDTTLNPTGGVRVGTSLVWSAISSYGSSQYMQLLMTIGAGQIESIDFDKTAFGQTPVRQFASQKTWTYESNGLTRFSDIVSGDTSDPARLSASSSDYVYRVRPSLSQFQEGFSQAFSPSTLNKFGVFAAIPININYAGRAEDGSRTEKDLGISATGLTIYWPDSDADKTRVPVPVGHQFTLTFLALAGTNEDNDDRIAASDARRAAFSGIDAASIYKLGSARFRVKTISDYNIEQANVSVVFECIKSGLCPQCGYGITFYKDVAGVSRQRQNDYFDTKCLIKVEEASYTTITQCRVVDFAIKARVFKRIQGRAPKYGDNTAQTYKDSDNGIKYRSAYFWFWYRKTTSDTWIKVNHVFCVRRSVDLDNFISLRFIGTDNSGGYEFSFDPIAETAAEMRLHGLSDFAFVENTGNVVTLANPDGTKIEFVGAVETPFDTYLSPRNNNPSEIDEWSLFSLRSDTQVQFSFDQGPELSIMAVTEQRIEPFSVYPSLYSNLAMFGFNAYSGQGIQDLRSVSVFVKKGKMVSRLRDDGTYPSAPDGASNLAPDIFLDTVLDSANGIGRYARIEGIDLQGLALANRFCRANQLYMDGVIAQQTPWRQFWSEVAPFSLLEFGRIGGKETLVPAVPSNAAGQITRAVSISALFNQGNIIEDSYKEEFIDYGADTQDLIATVVYRDTEIDEAFPRNNSVEVRRSGIVDAGAVRQSFDLSQFVTNRDQAIKFGKLICNQRQLVRRAIEFSTFPTDSVLSPGAYIYVAIGRNEWDRVSTGVVEAGGALNTPLSDAASGSGYTALLYRAGSPVVRLTGVSVSGGVSAQLSSYAGYMFVLGQTVTNKRVFRVTEVQMDEDGQVNVKALEHPCTESGSQTLSLIADFSDNLFQVR
jgi:hypothetical protein